MGWGKARDKKNRIKGTSGGEQARIDEVRGKDIIGTVFGDILLKHSKINHKNMSWNKSWNQTESAHVYFGQYRAAYVRLCVFFGSRACQLSAYVCFNASHRAWIDGCT